MMLTLDMTPRGAWPGSPSAQAQGCTCPDVDNELRRRRFEDKGAWVEDGCPLHGVRPVNDDIASRPWPGPMLR